MANALILIDTIDFQKPTVITDTSSGTGIDFAYQHVLPVVGNANVKITSGSLSLTHSGNLDDSPTREVWQTQTASGIVIGRLSKSDLFKTEDRWQISRDILNGLILGNPWTLEIGLSETTPFNNEKIELYRSELRLDYEQIPSTPEPALWLIFSGGLGLCALRRRKK